jgi:FtsX-like permease family protein
VIGLGLRLAVAGGREAVTRLVVIAAAVALGAGLLFATVAGINAVNAQTQRFAWLQTGHGNAPPDPAVDPLWWMVRQDYFAGQEIGRVEVAATGPHSPVPPGMPRLPGPGEYVASPAMSDLLATTPPAELGNRYPGRQVGTIGPAALPYPHALIIVIGRDATDLAALPGATRVTYLATDVDRSRAAGLDLVLLVVAAGLLFPVLIFIGTATRLTAARREQRFAAMRLVGATPGQISMIAAVEASIAAIGGTAAGFGLFVAFHRQLAAIPFTGYPFAPDDLTINVVDMLMIGLGVPVAAAVAALLALRRVRISPLGVTRRATPRAPRAYRLLPLLLGLGELAYFVGRRPETTNGQVAAFLSGILITMAGLVLAGPWLTMTGSRVLASRASRPATLIAARRLADNPKAAFRAISGVVLALFVTSVAVGVITTIVATEGPHRSGAAGTTLTQQFWAADDRDSTMVQVPDRVAAGLHAIAGVRDVVSVHHNPDRSAPSLPGVVSCAELARVPGLGRCPDGATAAQVWPDFTSSTSGPAAAGSAAWPAAAVSAAELKQLPLLSIVVTTDGSVPAIEQARTTLEVAYPANQMPPATSGDFALNATQTLAGWQQLATVIVLASLPIAGCSLAVSVTGGLSDRKRPFSLLRLTGVPLRTLRRVVALESAVPLLVAAAVAVATGLVAADLFLRAQMGYALKPPGVAYYAIVAIGIAASLSIIAATLPLLERMTGPETARNE